MRKIRGKIRGKILEKIRELEKNNILISAMFIIGFPTDNDDSIMKTINYAKKLNTTFHNLVFGHPTLVLLCIKNIRI